ncbi:hypothetical protein C8Q70DRAFT_938097 [Cubamyces menziesii]|nr:hypothetical protein C8Q70DRAFT_938097 [Cubamyces menziesii]
MLLAEALLDAYTCIALCVSLAHAGPALVAQSTRAVSRDDTVQERDRAPPSSTSSEKDMKHDSGALVGRGSNRDDPLTMPHSYHDDGRGQPRARPDRKEDLLHAPSEKTVLGR